MLSTLSIVSLDQGKLYGSKPTLDRIEAGIAADLGLQAGAVREGSSIGYAAAGNWLSRLREWFSPRSRRPQPNY